MKPGGGYVMNSLDKIGGIPLVMKKLLDNNLIHGNTLTVTGKTTEENINQYNKITGTTIPAINFLRNIITEGIRLNDLVGRELFIGEVKLKVHDLCRPCKNLQTKLNKKNIIKEFYRSRKNLLLVNLS